MKKKKNQNQPKQRVTLCVASTCRLISRFNYWSRFTRLLTAKPVRPSKNKEQAENIHAEQLSLKSPLVLAQDGWWWDGSTWPKNTCLHLENWSRSISIFYLFINTTKIVFQPASAKRRVNVAPIAFASIIHRRPFREKESARSSTGYRGCSLAAAQSAPGLLSMNSTAVHLMRNDPSRKTLLIVSLVLCRPSSKLQSVRDT